MAKKGMRRYKYDDENNHHSKTMQVPEIQGKAKHGKDQANPIIADTHAPALKVYHTTPFKQEKPISKVYSEIDNDLARDNLENDITAADLQDL